ncbi:MAG: selenide, water dikinase SelD [Oscillospiraceae bacterium]|nr:selenide, water dikinase SelD [Oscillospiraceae bacterium]
MSEPIVFCKGGGCTAKLGPGVLERVLSRLPQGERDPDLLIGFESKDDAAVYRVSEELAIVQTLDFFPPMVEDPYRFGQIAAANALSDVYAMGGEVRTALNIVCFPEKMDLNILGRILQGGAEKVQEAGGSLVGGHSIADDGVKYGLSVMGFVDPRRMWPNNGGQVGDQLILTKPLGVGILCTAARVGEAPSGALEAAMDSMSALNRTASEVLRDFAVHACTDVTGFGLLGHLHEMVDGRCSARIRIRQVPHFPEALACADEFLLTAAAQRNRNFLAGKVRFEGVPFAWEELLFDPQTSGGLLAAVAPDEAEAALTALRERGVNARCIGELTAPQAVELTVEQ